MWVRNSCVGSPCTSNHQQQQTFKFSRKARTEFCFDGIHGWCNIRTSFRIWHPDMQPVGAFGVCALETYAMLWALLIFSWSEVDPMWMQWRTRVGKVWSFNDADLVLEGHNWQCLMPDKSQRSTNWIPTMDHREAFNPEAPPQSV